MLLCACHNHREAEQIVVGKLRYTENVVGWYRAARLRSARTQRESGTANLNDAVIAYKNALLEFTHDRIPLKWAATQNNLGTALETLGGRESGSGHLNDAIIAYKNALLEYTRDRVPLKWAATQNNLAMR